MAGLAYVRQHGPIGALKAAARLLLGGMAVRTSSSKYAKWVRQREPSTDDLEQMRRACAAFPYQPLLSVVTPVSDTDPRWLCACVRSVERQAYSRWQLCLADDGSTNPETLDVLRGHAADPRVSLVTLETNCGISTALNAALSLVDGEFVAFLDHDDEIAPDALFEIVSHLNAHPETDVLYSDEDQLDHRGARCEVFSSRIGRPNTS